MRDLDAREKERRGLKYINGFRTQGQGKCLQSPPTEPRAVRPRRARTARLRPDARSARPKSVDGTSANSFRTSSLNLECEIPLILLSPLPLLLPRIETLMALLLRRPASQFFCLCRSWPFRGGLAAGLAAGGGKSPAGSPRSSYSPGPHQHHRQRLADRNAARRLAGDFIYQRFPSTTS